MLENFFFIFINKLNNHKILNVLNLKINHNTNEIFIQQAFNGNTKYSKTSLRLRESKLILISNILTSSCFKVFENTY